MRSEGEQAQKSRRQVPAGCGKRAEGNLSRQGGQPRVTLQGFKWGPFGSVQPQGQRFWNEDVEFGLKVSMHFTVSLRKRMEIRWPGLDSGFPTYYVVWDK